MPHRSKSGRLTPDFNWYLAPFDGGWSIGVRKAGGFMGEVSLPANLDTKILVKKIWKNQKFVLPLHSMAKKVETVNEKPTLKDQLGVRLTRVEILKKIDEIKHTKEREKVDLEEKKIRLERLKNKKDEDQYSWNSPISKLLDIARAWYIDNESCMVGGEPALRSMWTDREMKYIKSKIFEKMDDL